ncbi:MAG: ABC transporter permease [Actinomycetaceae bacterium]|nr:ABC transporter permease [Actinomycetaceae bacterium]
MKLQAFMRAVGVQVKEEVRINLLGGSLFGLLITPIAIIGISQWVNDTVIEEVQMTIGSYMFVSMLGGLAMMLVMHLNSEMMNDRLSGVLLRARSLPNGPLIWSVAKSTSMALLVFLMQAVLLIAAFILFDFSDMGIARILLLIGIMIFAVIAHAPLGLMLGVLNRGVWINMIILIGLLGVFITSGAAFPISVLPRWLQVIQLALPVYWSGHLARWAVLPAELGASEIVGGYQPLLAVGVLLAWIIIGYAIASKLVKRFFRAESIGTLAKLQSSLKNQLGV